MNRLVFEVQAPVVAADPNRADIACFVGFVARRKNTSVPAPVMRWLEAQGWIYPVRNPLKQTEYKLRYQVTGDVADLLDIPVPIDSWEVFDHLFEWERRSLNEPRSSNESGRFGATYLGAAVRSFFAQGGRKCYVIRVGDPWTYLPKLPAGLSLEEIAAAADEAGKQAAQLAAKSAAGSPPEEREKEEQEARLKASRKVIDDATGRIKLHGRCRRLCRIGRLIPGFRLPGECSSQSLPIDALEDLATPESSPSDRASWHGIGHLFGLPDVSFLCLPDLPDAVRVDGEPVISFTPSSQPDERFVECSQGEEGWPVDQGARYFRAPRCDDEGYRIWASALKIAASLVARRQREVQLVAAIPIPDQDSSAEGDLYGFLARANEGSLSSPLDASLTGLASAFVQLAYPWVRTPGSSDLPEQFESPDAVLVGVLARSALTRGAFHSAASLHLADVYDLSPILRSAMTASPESLAKNRSTMNLLGRVSLFGQTPSGLELLSDVTTSLDESYRPAGINRLVSSIVRAARRLGEESTFESSGEALWARIRDRLNLMLAGLLADGALSGESEADAFQLRCDRSTMSQNDIDNGRVVAEIRFQAAAPIEQITIVLALDEGGQVSLIAARVPEQVKEAA